MTRTERTERECLLLWRALDRIAQRRGTSLAQFARAAGCRAWGNPAYRVSKQTGAGTWPLMRTLAHILLHHGVSWAELGAAIETIKLGQEAEELERTAHDIAA